MIEYMDFYAYVFNTVRKMVRNREDAEDIAMQVILNAWQHRSVIQNPKAWICRDISFKLGHFFQSKRPLQSLEETPEVFLPSAQDSVSNIQMSSLDPVIQMKFVDGLSLREISKVLGLSLSGAKNRVYRAVKNLKQEAL